jgi:DNA-binding NtrC family response regulator
MSERHTAPLSRTLLPGARLQDCTLLVVDGPDQGRSVKLEVGRLTVGADPRCDLVLTDPTISGFHAELALLATGIRVRDLGSTNGIRFLGNRIHDAVLQPGSAVMMGGSCIAVLPPESSGLGPVAEDEHGPLFGSGEKMRLLFALMQRLEACDITVLIEGETGSGRTLVAETIHNLSDRRGPLVPVECGAISPHLIQSELFGHRRGAFTGAHEDRQGAVEAAAGGTLLLQEIGELPLDLQPTLLRFLETREVQPVGSPRPKTVDVRVIATTAHDLQQEARGGAFRTDLYYRLSVGRIRVPSLRERPEDILPLARRFLAETGDESDPEQLLTPGLAALLQSYPWPGNLRQLRNAIQRLMTLGAPFAESAGPPVSVSDFHSAKAELVERFERTYLEQLMRQHDGNLTAASKASGLVRHYLRAMLKKHGLYTDRGSGR